jgi:hypothetical protein
VLVGARSGHRASDDPSVLYLLVAVACFVPDRRIERVVAAGGQRACAA